MDGKGYGIFFAAFFAVLLLGAVPTSFADYTSPYKQMKQGVLPKDVICESPLVLVIRNNGDAACIREDSLFRLLQSNWAVKVIPDNTDQDNNSQDNDSQDKTGTWFPQSSSSDESMMAPVPSTPSPQFDHSSGGVSIEADTLNRSEEMSIGLAVGGAQDINNFRANIENDFLPLYTDITPEGLFYDYYFDTGRSQECEKLFCPSYSYAVSKDPFSKNDDYYLSVGLNSGIKESDFERKKLNLVIVLDISGSMDSRFNAYHYDDPQNTPSEDDIKSKMQLAKESVAGLIKHLDDGDSLGVVLFDNNAHVAKPLESMRITDKKTLEENILQIYANGGTNMESGLMSGTVLFDEIRNADSSEYENRIIFLTDAMPNLGDVSDSGLLGMISENAKDRIYTTFIGIGLDLNTELVEKITKVRGANYYSVHSASEFKNRMIEEFEFMVTLLVFNLLLNVDANGFDIKKVYGSPEADESTGQIMKINTLFPSKARDGETRGGIVLLKLEKTSSRDATITLKTSYEDRSGNLDGQQVTISLDQNESDYYENSGIHKGVLLSRYADLMKTWIFDERRVLYHDNDVIIDSPGLFYHDGLSVPPYVYTEPLGRWERQSSPLNVSDEYEKLIVEFNEYFYKESKLIGDDTLEQEIKILNKLENY